MQEKRQSHTVNGSIRPRLSGPLGHRWVRPWASSMVAGTGRYSDQDIVGPGEKSVPMLSTAAKGGRPAWPDQGWQGVAVVIGDCQRAPVMFLIQSHVER